MTDLNMPNLNKKSDKYLFKKRLTLRRKSKSKLLRESLLMSILSFLIIYLNYLIPNKLTILRNFPDTLEKSFSLSVQLLTNLFQIFLIIFIIVSVFLSIFLLLGSFYRLYKIINRKTKKISYK